MNSTLQDISKSDTQDIKNNVSNDKSKHDSQQIKRQNNGNKESLHFTTQNVEYIDPSTLLKRFLARDSVSSGSISSITSVHNSGQKDLKIEIKVPEQNLLSKRRVSHLTVADVQEKSLEDKERVEKTK